MFVHLYVCMIGVSTVFIEVIYFSSLANKVVVKLLCLYCYYLAWVSAEFSPAHKTIWSGICVWGLWIGKTPCPNELFNQFVRVGFIR